jgi:transposase InsO family protein
MAWREVTVVSARLEFVRLAGQPGANVKELCRRYGVSRPTGYKWLTRYEQEGEHGLRDRSRRPALSPRRSSAELEERVVKLRDDCPDWGGRKLRALLRRDKADKVPSASTITEILRRHERLSLKRVEEPAATTRFEHPAPNQLWQMDFKGDFALVDGHGSRCYPLTVLDDHSRFDVCLRACLDQRELTVQAALKDVFRRYGLPLRITADNGPPWGNTGEGLSWLAAWIVRLGIGLSHSRPYHPQTQGKDERFHRTLKLELLSRQSFVSPEAIQAAFDVWRERYNHVRPHEALGQEPPSSRYRVSPRAFPEELPSIEYDSQDLVRKVQAKGEISFRGQEFLIGRGLRGLPVALRETAEEGKWEVYFCHKRLNPIWVNGAPQRHPPVPSVAEGGQVSPIGTT